MRFLVNVLTLLMLCGLLAGLVHFNLITEREAQQREHVRSEVQRLQRMVLLQATLKQTEINRMGFPELIEPEWFNELPGNTLLEPHHPWLEVANEDQRDLHHPPNRVAVQRSDAQFWYNPANGLVRARVPSLPSDATALEMYNFINNSNVAALHESLKNGQRR